MKRASRDGFAVATKSESSAERKAWLRGTGLGPSPLARIGLESKESRMLSYIGRGKRVRIADVVDKFGAGAKSTLKDLKARGLIVIEPIDNRREITSRDEREAIIIAGRPHHAVYGI